MTAHRLFARSSLIAVCALSADCRQDDIVARVCANGAPCTTTDAGIECPVRPAIDGARYFSASACVCDSITASAPWAVDAFDSRNGPYPGPPNARADGADLLVNGQLATSALTVFGDVTVGRRLQAGTSSITVGANLAVGGAVAADGALVIGGNAEIAGDLRAASLMIGGRLTQPASASFNVAGASAISEIATASVTVAPPCACDAPLDIQAIIDAGQRRTTNDPEDLAALTGTATRTLACGEYEFRTIAGDALELDLTGPTIIYVPGDVSIDRLDIELAAGASLDLFVGGGWLVGDSSVIGDADRPAATRIAIATDGTVNLNGDVNLSGQVVAPTAEIVATGSLEVFGSLFVRRISGGGQISLHYDRAGGP